jgi:Uri superfamily endonuclease
MVKGIYVLIIRLDSNADVKVGALGEVSLKAGTYAYVGSAQANLEQRVRRHLRKEKRLFWHIDYLLANEHSKVEQVLYMEGEKPAECMTARQIADQGEPIVGFGCSDCHCLSHLFRIDDYAFLAPQLKPYVVM